MRRTIVLAVIFMMMILTGAFGQNMKKNAISLYVDMELESSILGDYRLFGVQYKNNFTQQQHLQGSVGISNLESIYIGADYLYDIPIIKQSVLFVLGGGIGVDFYNKKSFYGKRTFYLFRPQAGIDFYFPKTPFGIFAAYKPKFDVKEFDLVDASSIQFGVRYCF